MPTNSFDSMVAYAAECYTADRAHSTETRNINRPYVPIPRPNVQTPNDTVLSVNVMYINGTRVVHLRNDRYSVGPLLSLMYPEDIAKLYPLPNAP
jgi:hypothetical protein